MVLLSLYEYRFRAEDTIRWWGHISPTLCKRVFTLTGSGDAKTCARVTWRNFHCLFFLLLSRELVNFQIKKLVVTTCIFMGSYEKYSIFAVFQKKLSYLVSKY